VAPQVAGKFLSNMKTEQAKKLKDGARCKVIAGTHKGKTGTVHDIHASKTGHVTVTVRQENGERFKTLAKNIEVAN
jgi:ribosomal protein S4E